MNHATVLVAVIAVLAITGCSSQTADPEPTDQATGDELSRVGSASTASGVPASVLRQYAFWNVTGPNIPASPPAGSSCSAPLDAVAYDIVGCKNASDADITPKAPTGIYCSANDGSGVTSIQAACLGGWLMTIAAVNGKSIPSNVVLTGVNKVASSVTDVVLLECPTPPAGLAQHNVLYKAVYNDGVFADRVPAGCTPYNLTPQ